MVSPYSNGTVTNTVVNFNFLSTTHGLCLVWKTLVNAHKMLLLSASVYDVPNQGAFNSQLSERSLLVHGVCKSHSAHLRVMCALQDKDLRGTTNLGLRCSVSLCWALDRVKEEYPQNVFLTAVFSM